jgi:pimeloyl-ACP methyl ester carboxylesterase
MLESILQGMNNDPSLGPEKLNQQVQLPDGRRLGFAEYGDPQGTPIVYFHGWPSSRLEARVMRKTISEMGLRILAPDRPGYGLSEFKPGRAIVDWAEDTCALADHLNLGRFAVLGISGGGPYAVACAARLPERLTRVLLVCSMGPTENPEATKGMVPLNRGLLAFARNAPWLAQRVAGFCLRALWGTGDQVIPEQIEACLPERDRITLADHELRKLLTDSSREGLRPGVDGAAWEGFLFSRPWGFDLQQIRVPVSLWHGEKDVVVPPSMGHFLAKAIPGCKARFYPDDGHFSLPFSRMTEILSAAIA